MASDEFQNELRALRAKEYVDYTGVLKHKLRILRIVFDKAGLHHKSNNTPRSKQFKVYKEDAADTTRSHIVPLDEEARVEEIAHMLSGASLTDAAIENARALCAKRA